MYKKDRNRQMGLADFNQPIGLKMNPENRWVKKAETIPWLALGSLIIQKKYDYSDRELVEQLTENPVRKFSLAKWCYGLGLIRTKLDTTTRSSICLSIIAMNVSRLAVSFLREFLAAFFQGTTPDVWSYLVVEVAFSG